MRVKRNHQIEVKGARQNNLKNIDVTIPHNKLVVITGVSGSGKSSLAFDTLFAEGQRRYIESLSAYVRQFLGKIEKPEVDFIKGLSPAIAIQQKVNTSNPRSTVGTTTEIYDYLKLLFARIGTTYSPKSGKIVQRHTVNDVLEKIKTYPTGTKALVVAPIQKDKTRNLADELQILRQKGFSRVYVDDRLIKLDEMLDFVKGEDNSSILDKKALKKFDRLAVVVDRISIKPDDKENNERTADSIQTAFFEADGYCDIYIISKEENSKLSFSNRFELDGISFEEPSVNLFTFNNPYGACKTCEGFGTVIGIDHEKVVPDVSLSVFDGAISCWKGEKMSEWQKDFIHTSAKFKFPIHRPYVELSDKEKNLLWEGKGACRGIYEFFQEIQTQAYKIQYRILLSRYKGKTPCEDCKGTRLRKDARYIMIQKQNISDLVLLPIDELLPWIKTVKIKAYEREIAARILVEITNRLQFLNDVGLGYLSLNRDSRTLSGGESQRIQLVTSLGSNLTGSMYVLDEPSIGLHSKDTEKLIQVLKNLRDLRNTVLVVEHDEDIIKEADFIIDIGPLAGSEGGDVVFSGTKKLFDKESKTLTGEYMRGLKSIAIPNSRPAPEFFISIEKAYKHNLKNIDASIALFRLNVITGVSGSGKSTLVKDVLYPSLLNKIRNQNGEAKNCLGLTGDIAQIQRVEYVDQNPIGRSSRSNPITYLKAYDPIRALFASQGLAKQRGLSPSHFSFNVDGGRCETCKGDGYLTVEMQFMADLQLICDDCNGKRFKNEILEIRFKDKNIADILEMTVNEALTFFDSNKELTRKLSILQDVGLGYLGLGQSSNTLSGGEAQRVKLAFFLAEGNKKESLLFIFDEPTTGLHFHDINYLMTAFYKLLDQGHTVLVIEHNLDVIKCADWLIDLGPEGGKKGGNLVYQGPAKGILKTKKSVTAPYLKEKFSN